MVSTTAFNCAGVRVAAVKAAGLTMVAMLDSPCGENSTEAQVREEDLRACRRGFIERKAEGLAPEPGAGALGDKLEHVAGGGHRAVQNEGAVEKRAGRCDHPRE